jgi:hypothetical protein
MTLSLFLFFHFCVGVPSSAAMPPHARIIVWVRIRRYLRNPHGHAVDDIPIIMNSQWQALRLLPRPALLSPRIAILAALQPLVHVKVELIDLVVGARWWRPIQRRRVRGKTVFGCPPPLVTLRNIRLWLCWYYVCPPTEIHDVPAPCLLVVPVCRSD